MAPKTAAANLDNDPIDRALDAAPLDDLADSDEERAELASRRANPVFVSGLVVSGEIAGDDRHDG
jgi:hypothetical protein